jgi:GntR family transcriptional regulator
MSVDRHNPIPFYLQVCATLRQQIHANQYKVGDSLPSENDLCKMFDVSRTVIRQALNELKQEGLINREKGRGSFVAQPKLREKFFQKLSGFYQDMVDQGYEPVTQVLKQTVIAASTTIAEKLHIPLATPVIEIERLRFIEDEPIMHVVSHLPHARCPELLQANLTYQSLYTFLETNCGIFITRGKRSIEAVAASKRQAELLGIKRGAPLIQLESVSYESSGVPIETYSAVHRGDRTRFEVEVLRTRDDGLDAAPLQGGTVITPRKQPHSNG